MNTLFDELLQKHQALQQEAGAEATPEHIERVKRVMAEIVAAGEKIGDPRRRDNLRSVLRYWGAWVYERTGEYPPSQLAPAAPEIMAGNAGLFAGPRAWLWAGAAVVVVLGVVWAIFALSQTMAQATPTAVPGAVEDATDRAALAATQTALAEIETRVASTVLPVSSATPFASATPAPPTLTPSLTPSPTITPSPTTTFTPTPGPTPTPGFAVALRGHSDTVMALAFSPDGALLASGGLDRTVRVWDVARQTLRQAEPVTVNQWVFSLVFASNGSRVFVGSGFGLQGGGQVGVLDVDQNDLLFQSDTLFIDNVTSLALDRFGTRLAVGSIGNAPEDDTVFLRLLQPDSLSRVAPFSDNPIFSVAFSPDGDRLLYGGTDRALYVRDLRTANNQRTTIAAQDRHSGFVRGVAFSPVDGTLAASASEDGTLRLWRLGDRAITRLATLQSGAARLFALAFSPDGRQIAAAGASPDGNSLVELWDVAAAVEGDPGEPFTLSAAAAEIGQTVNNQSALAFRAVAYSPDGRLLAAAGDDPAIFIWTVR